MVDAGGGQVLFLHKPFEQEFGFMFSCSRSQFQSAPMGVRITSLTGEVHTDTRLGCGYVAETSCLLLETDLKLVGYLLPHV